MPNDPLIPEIAGGFGLASSGATATSADELALLIDGATNYAIYMLDPQGVITIWNRGAERIKGWSAAEIVGRYFSISYPAEDIAEGKPAADLARAHAEGRVEDESWRVRKDGSEFLANITITALYDDAGALRGFGKVVRDITDQRAAEKAIASRERHLASILATVPDAMVVIDEHGRIGSFSAAAERLFGHAEADVVGRDVTMLMPEADRNPHDGFLATYRATGVKRAIGSTRTATGLRRNGEEFPMELSIGETTSGGQRIFTGFIRDLTERRLAERHVQELQSELIHMSRLSAMGTMASTLAHELNQPLTAIANYVETTRDMLAQADTPELTTIRDALGLAAAQSLRAGDIVRRLREFVAHGEVGRAPEILSNLVNEAAGLALIGSREAGVRVTIALDAEARHVLVDRVQIEQVIVNLIRNAVQAMQDSATRELTISTALETVGCVQVSIADTGTGIAPDILDRLFQAFATTKDEGMGLGLSICRTIVEAHGGRIWATSRAGGGPRSTSRSSSLIQVTPMSAERLVHIVDDDEAIRASAGFLLRTNGYSVASYASGVAFLAAVGRETIGCVLLDIRMPDLDGLVVQSALAERGLALPVIMLTGHGDIALAVRSIKAGAVEFLEKPFQKAALLAAIEEAFRRVDDAERVHLDAADAVVRLAALTARESDVLRGIVKGQPNKITAYDLGISTRTVEAHRAALMTKLHARSLSEVLRIAFAAGLGE